jgi:hypothetical protein
MASNTLAQLSYEAALRSLDLQERAVEQLRARTATLLAASSLTASFLGAQTIQRVGGLGMLVALALILLVASVGLCTYILVPRRAYSFGVGGRDVYESLAEFSEDEDEVRRRLVYWLAVFWRANQTELEELDRYYLAAAAALVLQLVLWTLALAATLR